MKNKAKILVCVGNPNSAENSISYASIMAKKFSYTIELLSVIDIGTTEFQGLFSIGKKISADIRKDVEDKLTKFSDIIYKEHKFRTEFTFKKFRSRAAGKKI